MLDEKSHEMILQKQIDYTIWANGEWVQFISERNLDHPKLLLTMSHILLSERVWLERIKGKIAQSEIWTTLPGSRLKEYFDQSNKEYHLLLRDDLERVVTYKRFRGEEFHSSVADILIHLTNHGAHHRGQMAMITSSLNIRPLNTDYIQYCRLEK